jgi:hypothetical protein
LVTARTFLGEFSSDAIAAVGGDGNEKNRFVIHKKK